jgi:hypothetical protein
MKKMTRSASQNWGRSTYKVLSMKTIYPAERSIDGRQHAFFERGADQCMSAGFQVVEVISTIGRFDIFESDGTRDLNERFGPETVSGTKIDSKSMPNGRCRSHEPQRLVGN